MPVKYRIHPAIGIARVGDSPDDFFIGPEAPGVPPVLTKPDGSSSQPGKYKDKNQRIKRQGARFRIYEYTEDAAGKVTKVREITAAEAAIEWEVHLANRKAAEKKFNGGGRRNAGKPESDLIIDAGAQHIVGTNQAMRKLTGKFMRKDVKLGDLLTDAGGRLIVLGGHGLSQSPAGVPLSDRNEDFADNDGWCDDVADGPVRATVRLTGGAAPVVADPAWVIVAPPDFAPAIENVVTLYDAVYDVMARFDPRLAVTDATKISFTKDIYPILRRVSYLQWVSDLAAGQHGEGGPNDFLSQLSGLGSNKEDDSGARGEVFRALRRPQGGRGTMPKLPPLADKAPGASLTATQYKRMELWAKGKFEADWTGVAPTPAPLEQLSKPDQPQALDRAALESCVGGPFFPGIEASRVMLDDATYDRKRPFRINADHDSGRLTAGMAVPWQSDFHDCTVEEGADWWPGQRPNQVRRDPEPGGDWVPEEWGRAEMTKSWAKLGFVVEKKIGDKVVKYVEEERSLELKPPLVA
jgi:L-lysine epsilon oxidase-like protein